MTKPAIRTYEDLLREKSRLEALLQVQKDTIRQDVVEIKEGLKPIRTAIGVIGTFATRDNSNPLLTSATEGLVNLVVKKLLLARSGWITKLVVPFLVKNISSHLVNDNQGSILSALFSFFGKKGKPGSQDTTRTEDDDEFPGRQSPDSGEPVEEKAI